MAIEAEQLDRQATAEASADLSLASFMMSMAGSPNRSASQSWLYAHFAVQRAALAVSRFGTPHHGHGGADDKVEFALSRLPLIAALSPPPHPPTSQWLSRGIGSNPDGKRATCAARHALVYANAFLEESYAWFASNHPEVVAGTDRQDEGLAP